MRDTQFTQVRDLLDQPGKGAGTLHAAGRMPREAADMQLVDDRPVQASRRDRFACTVERCRDDRTQSDASAILRLACRAPVPHCIAHRARPRIEQFAPRLEGGRPVGAPRVAGSRRQPFDKDVPEKESAVVLWGKHNDLKRLGALGRCVKQQFQPHGVTGEDAEIDPIHRGGRARRKARPRTRWVGLRHQVFTGECTRPPLRGTPRSTQPRAILIGCTFQIRSQYSRIARSEENFPARAVLRIDICIHLAGSRQAALTRSWQAR